MPSKIIVVCGATGQLGGSVARRMLQEGWKVRGLTRNHESAAAKALKDAGAELASASFDDVGSLSKAFEGAQAVFGVTTMFEDLMALGSEKASKKEFDQIMNIATAASRVEGLEHFVMHTLPSGRKLRGEEYHVPHMDNKDEAADMIKKQLPELAAKTTFVWVGIFTTNFFSFPMMVPVEIPNSYGAHVYIQPCKPTTPLYQSGYLETNVGLYVAAILKKPQVSTPAKVALVQSECISIAEMLAVWSEVTGRRATFLQCSVEEYEQLWGVYGKEIGVMFRLFDSLENAEWSAKHEGELISAKDLGIEGKLIGLKEALEKDKDKL